MKKPNTPFGMVLRRKRLAMKANQKDFAEMIGVTQGWYSILERESTDVQYMAIRDALRQSGMRLPTVERVEEDFSASRLANASRSGPRRASAPRGGKQSALPPRGARSAGGQSAARSSDGGLLFRVDKGYLRGSIIKPD